MNNDILYDKYLGAFMGAAIGDALGWPNEDKPKSVKRQASDHKFINWEKKGGGRYWPYSEPIMAGEYSDDTQLIFSVARSMMMGDHWNKYFARIELPAWAEYERGGGGATKRAAEKWTHNIYPWEKTRNSIKEWQSYFNAGGNGVAMRVLPIVLYHIGEEYDIYKKIFINGIGTHGHPRALIGALLYGKALEYLLLKKTTLEYGELIDHLLLTSDRWGVFPDPSFSETWMNNAYQAMDLSLEWQKTVGECLEMLTIVKDKIGMGVLDFTTDTYKVLGTTGEFKGSGTISAISAVYIASKYAASPESGVIEAAFLFGADTDTVASMVGGLMGALHGTTWITNGWHEIQDIDYIKILAKKMYQREIAEDQALYHPESDKTLKKQLKNAPLGSGIYFPVFKEMKVKDCKDISTLKMNSILEYKLSTELGQTIYIKIFGKNMQQKEINKRSIQQDMNLDTYYSEARNQKTAYSVKEETGWYLSDAQIMGLAAILAKSVPARELLNFISYYKNNVNNIKDLEVDNIILHIKNEFGFKWANKNVMNKIVEIIKRNQ